MSKTIFAISALALLSGCATFPAAQMAQPAGFTRPADVIISGIGGGRSGRFVAGDLQGNFTRSDDRLALFDSLLETRSGAVAFETTGMPHYGPIAANCRVRQREVNLAFINFTPAPMALRCEFRHEGQSLPARFELQAAAERVATMRARRVGEIVFDRSIVQIRSEHRLAGSAMTSATPIGYVFEVDGQARGSLQLNGAPEIRFHRDADASDRNAISMAALVLALLWDPADSALGG